LHSVASETPDDRASLITNEPAWRQLAVFLCVFVGHGGQALIYDALPPVLVPLAKHFGGGAEGAFVAQVSATTPLLGVGLAGLAAGPIIERLGLRTTLIASILMFGFMGTIGMVITVPWEFVASRLVMGLSVGLMTPCSTALIAYKFSAAKRPKMNGLLVSASAVMAIVFIYISGFVATVWSWRAPFALHAALALFFLVPALGLRSTPVGGSVQRHLTGRIAPLRSVALLFPIGFALLALTFMFNAKLAFLLANVGIAAPNMLARIFSCNPIGTVIGTLLFARIKGRFDPRQLLYIAFALTAIGLIVAGTASRPVIFASAVLLNGLTNGIGLSTLWTWVMDRAAPGYTARALGLMSAALNLGASLSPLLVAPLALVLSDGHQYFAIAATIMVAIAATMLWTRAPATV
jgi:MFS family permease